MKSLKYTLALLFMCSPLAMNAQWLRIWNAGESTRVAVSEATNLPYSAAGSSITIAGTTYSTAEIDSITIVNPVKITWNGSTATYDMPESVEGVNIEVNGGDVVINNTNITSEQEFILAGTSTAGSLTYNGTFKTKFHLAGLNLTSTSGAALDIQCGKRIDLILEDGTTNSLADAVGGTQKAALNCQGHLEIAGGGSLTIAGKAAHALRSNEYLFLKKSVGQITITEAAGDAIHCGEYFLMNGGTVTISSADKDGLQVETDDNSDELLNGQLIINGGSLTVNVSNEDVKGIRLDAAETNTSITPEMSILGGEVTVNVTATAKGSKGIASDGNITIGDGADNDPVVTVNVAGGVFVDEEEEDQRAVGMKATKTLTIAGGKTEIYATGTQSRGVRAYTLIATAGSLTIRNTGSGSQGLKLDKAPTISGGVVDAILVPIK